MTPEQLREHAKEWDIDGRYSIAEIFRAHAAALEEIERLKYDAEKCPLWKREAERNLERAKRAEAALAEAERKGAAKQAEIDRLMLEFCPGEMTPEQLAEWGRHQRAEFKEG